MHLNFTISSGVFSVIGVHTPCLRATAAKNVLDVRRAKNAASASFYPGVLISRFLRMARLTLTWMNSAPSRPPITPSTHAAGRSSKELSRSSNSPNFKAAESVKENAVPLLREVKIESRKVAKDDAKKTLQSMLNVQNVFGFDIS